MNLKELKELIDLIQQSEIAELEWEKSGVKVRIKKERSSLSRPPIIEELPPVSSAPQEAPVPPTAPDLALVPAVLPAGWLTLTAPVVGTFYRSPAPDADPYAEVGNVVKKGQIICVIEAMKLMNEIESEWDGKIVEILVENAQPVEYGEPLFHIEPLTPA